MAAIGNIVGKAFDAAGGAASPKSGTTLEDFLSQFTSSEGIWAKTIDPYSTFDVSMKFYPGIWTQPKDKEDKSWLQNVGDSVMSSAKSAVKEAANSVTGGLLGSMMNSKVDIMRMHNKNLLYGVTTFMEYLAAANLIVGKEDWVGEKAGEAVRPLELQLGLYCQEIVLPNIEVPIGETSQSLIGEFPINGTYVKTDAQTVQLKILNTKVPLHERIFYPWMREITMPWWSYNEQPYTTATITVDLTKHCDIKYIFCGCRPIKISTHQPVQQATSTMTRDVTFTFDYMFVGSDLKNCEDVKDRLMSTGKSLVNGALQMING